MSTKNLARTAIEGGRCGHNKYDRHESSRVERAQTREYLGAIRDDLEVEEDTVAPKRKPVHPCFSDKLSPVWRFLDSRVGKSWNKTLSMITEKFDPRSTPGRHVLNDHMLKQVATSKGELETTRWFGRHSYYVDPQGILRRVAPTKARTAAEPKVPWSLPEVVSWLGNRKVGRLGSRYVWFHPTRGGERIRPYLKFNEFLYVVVDGDGKVIMDPIFPVPTSRWAPKGTERLARVKYRQGRLLEPADEKYLLGLPKTIQQAIFKAAPVNVNTDGVIQI